MEDIAELTPDLFTAETGIEVNYTVLEEGNLREVVTRDVGAGGEQFDVVMIGMYEAPQFGVNGWLIDLTPLRRGRRGLPARRPDPDGPRRALGRRQALRVTVLRRVVVPHVPQGRARRGRPSTMPDNPTWDEVAEIARAVDSDEMAGICLRGKPGWGDLGASFTTVLNTFGGTWWSANEDGTIGEAQVDQPEFKEALQFYVDLINDAGEDDAANASFNECLAQYRDGKVAMWYDATVAAGLLEADDSPVKGMNGYAIAPVKETDASGWLWSWALAIPAELVRPRPRLAVRLMGHRARVHRRGRRPSSPVAGQRSRRGRGHRRTRSPSTRRPPPPSPMPRWRRWTRRRSTTRGRHRARAPRRAVRRRPAVPGCRHPLHRGVLQRDRRTGRHRRCAQRLPGHRLPSELMS